GAKIYTFADNNFESGELRFVSNRLNIDPNISNINSTGATAIISRKTDGRTYITNADPGIDKLWLTADELNSISCNLLHIGNHINTNNSTERVVVGSVININKNVELNTKERSEFQSSTTFNVSGNLTITGEGQYTPLSDLFISPFVNISATGNLNINTDDCKIYRDGVISANDINIYADNYVYLVKTRFNSNKDISFISNEFKIDSSYDNFVSTFNATEGRIIFSRSTEGNYYIGEQGIINPDLLSRFNTNEVVIGNHINTNNNTNNIFISKDITTNESTKLTLEAKENIYSGRAIINANGDINLIAVNGNIGELTHYININQNETGNISASASENIFLNEISGNMNINNIISNNNGDIYLTLQDENGSIIDYKNDGTSNITGGNLYIKNPVDMQSFYYIGIAGDATRDNKGYSTTFFLEKMKAYGQNWANIPSSNVTIFDDTVTSFDKIDILGTLEFYASKMRENDMLFINYNGHGGSDNDNDPIDENNGTALNLADEYLVTNSIEIFDDEFANALKDSRGTVVFVTGQCMSGMFGGNTDLDHIADNNGFKYYGMAGAREGLLAFGRGYYREGQNFSIADISYTMLDSLTEANPIYITWQEDAVAMQDIKYINLGHAQNANGNVYLNEWFDAVKREDTYWIFYNGETYPEILSSYTNMSAEELINTPVIIQNWEQNINYITINKVGTIEVSLKTDLTGNLEIYSNDYVNLSGNINGKSFISTENTGINFSGSLTDTVKLQSLTGEITINDNSGDLIIDSIQTQNDINILASGNILNGNENELTNLAGNNISIRSTNGSIGSLDKALDIQLNYNSENGTLNATALEGNINISNNEGDLYINKIESNNDVKLTSAMNIINSGDNDQPTIIARNISLSAANGKIGDNNNRLNLYLDHSSVKAFAKDDIYLYASYSGNSFSLTSTNGLTHLSSRPAQAPSVNTYIEIPDSPTQNIEDSYSDIDMVSIKIISITNDKQNNILENISFSSDELLKNEEKNNNIEFVNDPISITNNETENTATTIRNINTIEIKETDNNYEVAKPDITNINTPGINSDYLNRNKINAEMDANNSLINADENIIDLELSKEPDFCIENLKHIVEINLKTINSTDIINNDYYKKPNKKTP
ncbi:MAG: hypothetical protein AB1782_05980, partial [Cyanobacteriota bacterium]